MLKYAETWWKNVETCWNMVMFILVSIVYHDGVWQLEKRLSCCVHSHISK
jgi:hypothetical protein